MRKAPSTFSALMQANVLIVTLCVVLILAVTFITIRDNHIDTQMLQLRREAADIASIAGTLTAMESDPLLRFSAAPVRQLLSNKARHVYENYAAYSLVVDKTGQVSTYFLSILGEHKELQKTFAPENILMTLQKVLDGQESITQVNTQDGPMFTVAVPMLYNQRTIGAVYIQTAAQTIRHASNRLIIKIFMIALVVLLFAAIVSWRFYTRFTRPLFAMNIAAKRVAEGQFDIDLPMQGTEEIQSLSNSFQLMSRQLAKTEETRKEFIANVSHELRSPMTNIQGFLEGILDGTIDQENQSKYLNIVLSETKRMSKLVRALLDLSRMEHQIAPNLSNFDLHELIRRVIIAKVNVMENKKQTLDIGFPDAPLMVSADRDQIEQVLNNLIDNAIKYTPNGGNIAVHTKENGQQVWTSVEDNGIGILPEDAPYVFDRFYMAQKAHTAGTGTGLGLAICKKILDNHNQTIRLLPQTDGTRFEFSLNKAAETERSLHDT